MEDTQEVLETEGATVLNEERSVKQLQEEVTKLGMPAEDAALIKTRQPLISMINTLKAAKASVKVEKVATIEERENPVEEKQVEKEYRSKAYRMRDLLEAQPKVRFLIPTTGAEKPGVIREVMIRGRKEQVHVSGAIEVVQLNGYKTLIPKGVFIDVPKQIAEVLQESMEATQKAGADMLVDRVDPQTGKPVANQL